MPLNRRHNPRRRFARVCNSALAAVVLASVTLPAQASSCRAGTAASTGSQAGYNTAKQAADSWAQREQQTTDSLSECLGDISTTIVMPTFPNLSQILNQIEQKVCSAAQSEIDEYIPDTIDPWSDMDINTNVSLNSSRAVTLSAPVSAVPQTTQATEPVSTTAPSSGDTDTPLFNYN